MPDTALKTLQCPECGSEFSAEVVQTICSQCASPLLARYALEGATLQRGVFSQRPRSLWRWAELLPVRAEQYRLTLGEGNTPLLHLPRLGNSLGLERLYLKDESANPTGSFKSRGMAVAVSRAWELGIPGFVLPTAGNAGGALAAYAARAGLEAHIFMPADAPRQNQIEVEICGAQLHRVDGLIDAAAKQAAAFALQSGYFNMATFREPYRVEGKKTMGLELAEAFGWELPEVILYPTGGGTGLVGMWKAFDEMERLGWVNSRRPRMVSVQAAGCAPVVRAFTEAKPRAEPWQQAHTLAHGLRVPGVFADRLILQALRHSSGEALTVTDEEILAAQQQLARSEGIFACPEGAATVAALHQLKASGWLKTGERIVLFNTGSGLKYV